MRRCIHFVGFRGDEFTPVIRVFGPPDFVFAKGSADQAPRVKSFDDIRE